MAMTATERSRVLRGRRTQSKVVLTVVVGEDELAEIARAGYAEAASTDRKSRAAAVSLFLSDAVWGLTMRRGDDRQCSIERRLFELVPRGRLQRFDDFAQHDVNELVGHGVAERFAEAGAVACQVRRRGQILIVNWRWLADPPGSLAPLTVIRRISLATEGSPSLRPRLSPGRNCPFR
jgi:hypothetical protein